MKLKHLTLTILSTTTLLGAASLAHAQSWRMATPYPEQNFHTQNIRQFVADMVNWILPYTRVAL